MSLRFRKSKGVAKNARVNFSASGSKAGASISKRVGPLTLNTRGTGSMRIAPGLSFRFGKGNSILALFALGLVVIIVAVKVAWWLARLSFYTIEWLIDYIRAGNTGKKLLVLAAAIGVLTIGSSLAHSSTHHTSAAKPQTHASTAAQPTATPKAKTVKAAVPAKPKVVSCSGSTPIEFGHGPKTDIVNVSARDMSCVTAQESAYAMTKTALNFSDCYEDNICPSGNYTCHYSSSGTSDAEFRCVHGSKVVHWHLKYTFDDGATDDDSTGDAVTYSNCAEVEDAGAAPLSAGDPGYSSSLDRDGDGIACDQ